MGTSWCLVCALGRGYILVLLSLILSERCLKMGKFCDAPVEPKVRRRIGP
jgi:hypothetical protein